MLSLAPALGRIEVVMAMTGPGIIPTTTPSLRITKYSGPAITLFGHPQGSTRIVLPEALMGKLNYFVGCELQALAGVSGSFPIRMTTGTGIRMALPQTFISVGDLIYDRTLVSPVLPRVGTH